MYLPDHPSAEPVERYVSTGRLPDGVAGELLSRALSLFSDVGDGDLSRVYPVLAEADPAQFGLALVGVNGLTRPVGDARVAFTVMSIAKPFVFALVSEAIGISEVRGLVGVNPTGLPFNSIAAVERADRGRTNPMVNAGAIATTSLTPGANRAEKWEFLRQGLSRFAGRELQMDQAVYASEAATNQRNQGIALSRQQLIDGVWGADWFGDDRTVDVHVRQLRKKLGDDLPLATVWGVGYRLG